MLNGPFAETLMFAPPLSWSTTVPMSPETFPPTVNVEAEQTTDTFETLIAPSVPEPFATTHISPAGCADTVTEYALPLGRTPGNVKDPSAGRLRSPPPLSCSTTVPVSPETVPPTVRLIATHTTATLATFAPASAPLPFPTVQTCPAG